MLRFGKPMFLIRPLIKLFGYYYTETWYNEDGYEEGGLFYRLFGVDVCYGSYFID